MQNVAVVYFFTQLHIKCSLDFFKLILEADSRDPQITSQRLIPKLKVFNQMISKIHFRCKFC